MKLRNLFEAPEKTAAFAFGRLNPATNGHELLVEEIKKQGVDSFLFLSDRPAKVPTDPLSPQEKLDWARKSFNGIAVGLAKTALIAADRLYKMGYTNLIYLEGEPKMGKVIQTYNGQKKDLHDYNFKSIDLVRLTRDPDAEDPTGMSASKLRQTVLDNNLQGFMSGVTKQAQPHAEEMFKKLQGIMGVDAVEERSLSKDEEKKKEKYVKGMKKNKGDFKDRYGKDAEAVMYATATKMAKEDANIEIPVVDYDRNYGGDINKVLAVKPNAQADAKKIYQQLGGISNENYKKMQKLVQAKIKELRTVYRSANAKQGLKGKDALHSPHYKLFRKQSNDLKIMMSNAMDMMIKASGAKPGQIIKPNVTPGYTAKIIGKESTESEYKGNL